jgi:hypothetical protein
MVVQPPQERWPRCAVLIHRWVELHPRGLTVSVPGITAPEFRTRRRLTIVRRPIRGVRRNTRRHGRPPSEAGLTTRRNHHDHHERYNPERKGPAFSWPHEFRRSSRSEQSLVSAAARTIRERLRRTSHNVDRRAASAQSPIPAATPVTRARAPRLPAPVDVPAIRAASPMSITAIARVAVGIVPPAIAVPAVPRARPPAPVVMPEMGRTMVSAPRTASRSARERAMVPAVVISPRVPVREPSVMSAAAAVMSTGTVVPTAAVATAVAATTAMTAMALRVSQSGRHRDHRKCQCRRPDHAPCLLAQQTHCGSPFKSTTRFHVQWTPLRSHVEHSCYAGSAREV